MFPRAAIEEARVMKKRKGPPYAPYTPFLLFVRYACTHATSSLREPGPFLITSAISGNSTAMEVYPG